MSTSLMNLLQETLLQAQPEQKAASGLAANTDILGHMTKTSPPPGLAPPPLGFTPPPPGLTPLAIPGVDPHSQSGPKPAAAPGLHMAGLISELVTVVAELSRLDAMIQKAAASVPKGAEALKWHEVSMRALSWSRESLAARQREILDHLRAQAGSQGALKPAEVASERSQEASPCTEVGFQTMPTEAKDLTPAQEPDSREGAEYLGSLSSDLEKLRTYDAGCVVLVRKIKQLGLRSPEWLREHFARGGELVEVMVSHSFEKPSAKRRLGRIRPGALGFIVFASPAAAEAVLAAGEEQLVGAPEGSAAILVKRYEPTDFLGAQDDP